MLVLCVLVLFLLAAAAAAVYCYRCLHYWQGDLKRTISAGFEEKDAALPDGSVIHYAEGPAGGPPLLLIHGQTGTWADYARVLPALSENWHVYAVDCYGHGASSHNESKYYLRENGDDLIWFLQQVVGEPAVVSGHSSGGLLAAYAAAHGGAAVAGAVLEDPPVFSTEPGNFETSFACLDTYKPMHDYTAGPQTECWEAYYMRRCLWGQLYMASSMEGLANYAQHYHETHPGQPVQYFFMPESINFTFLYTAQYDFRFGGHFYDYSWHSGISHADLLAAVKVPTVFLHTKASYTERGVLLAASSDEQARQAVQLIGDCELIELSSNHHIHRFTPQLFIPALNCIL